MGQINYLRHRRDLCIPDSSSDDAKSKSYFPIQSNHSNSQVHPSIALSLFCLIPGTNLIPPLLPLIDQSPLSSHQLVITLPVHLNLLFSSQPNHHVSFFIFTLPYFPKSPTCNNVLKNRCGQNNLKPFLDSRGKSHDRVLLTYVG